MDRRIAAGVLGLVCAWTPAREARASQPGATARWDVSAADAALADASADALLDPLIGLDVRAGRSAHATPEPGPAELFDGGGRSTCTSISRRRRRCRRAASGSARCDPVESTTDHAA